MKALSIDVNGHLWCIAGMKNGDVAAYLSAQPDGENGEFGLMVLGRDFTTQVPSLWPSPSLKVGDSVTITIVEADDATPAQVLRKVQE